MTNSIIVWVIVLLLLAGGGWYYFSLMQPAPLPDTATERTQDSTDSTNTPDEGINAPMLASVSYSSSGFAPGTVTIKRGGTVTWVDQGTNEMWVGSGEHPTHTHYDGTSREEHCLNGASTTFDQCSVGGTYSFTFDKVGTWEYHNHRESSHVGQIVVTP